MDRFIENQSEQYNQEFSDLKSNMDRFIEILYTTNHFSKCI